jgi:hypothetical protein
MSHDLGRCLGRLGSIARRSSSQSQTARQDGSACFASSSTRCSACRDAAAACKAFDLISVPRGTSPKGTHPKGTTRWLAAHIGWPHARGDGHTSRKGGAERQLWQYSVDIPTIAANEDGATRHYGVAGPRVRLPGSEAWPITAATRSELYQKTAQLRNILRNCAGLLVPQGYVCVSLPRSQGDGAEQSPQLLRGSGRGSGPRARFRPSEPCYVTCASLRVRPHHRETLADDFAV